MGSDKSKSTKKSEKGKVIDHEPKSVLDARRDMLKKYHMPWITIGVVILIGFLWLLNLVISSLWWAIGGLIALILSLIFIVYGYFQKKEIRELKPITVYENGLDVTLLDEHVEFVKFMEIAKFPIEMIDGHETVIVKKEEGEIPILIWPKVKKILFKKNNG